VIATPSLCSILYDDFVVEEEDIYDHWLV
jgi:hypothetical protein